MRTAEDVRRDPRPGDVVRKKFQGQYFESRGYIERQVDWIDGEIVCYVGPGVCAPEIRIQSWRRWAKDAEVLHIAQEAAE